MNAYDVLAKLLADKNKLLDYKPNSIYAALARPDGPSPYTADIIGQIGLKLKNETSFFRNSINPLLEEYVTKFTEEISKVSNISPISKYKVEPYVVPDIAKKLTVKDNKSLTGTIPDTGLNFTVPNPSTIRNFFISNNDLKSEATNFVNSLSDETLITFWNKYLTNVNSTNTAFTKLKTGNGSNLIDLCLCVIVFTYFVDNQPAYETMDNSIYKKHMNKTLSELNGHLNFAVKVHESTTSSGKLISEIFDNCSAIVNPDVYSKFLEDGGSVETILGYVVTDDKTDTDKYATALLTNSGKYLSKWKKVYDKSIYTVAIETVRNHKALHVIFITKFLETMVPESLKQYVKVDAISARSAIEALLDDATDDVTLDIYLISRCIFGKVYFASTNYYTFTEYMIANLSLFKDNDNKKAASFAGLDMVMDYLLGQIDIKEV